MTTTNEGLEQNLEDKITSLEKQLKRAVSELTFMGDRNFRMEAYIDCLIYTLRKMDVAKVIDLNEKALPLSLFHVKAKAGYHLGSFNLLPRRSLWSYNKDGKKPPVINLSGNPTMQCKVDDLNNSFIRNLEEQNLIPKEGDDIGLSVDQLVKYESQITDLEQKVQELNGRLQFSVDRERILSGRVKALQDNSNVLEEEVEKAKSELSRTRFQQTRHGHQWQGRHAYEEMAPPRFRRPRYFHPPPPPPPLQLQMPLPPMPPYHGWDQFEYTTSATNLHDFPSGHQLVVHVSDTQLNSYEHLPVVEPTPGGELYAPTHPSHQPPLLGSAPPAPPAVMTEGPPPELFHNGPVYFIRPEMPHV